MFKDEVENHENNKDQTDTEFFGRRRDHFKSAGNYQVTNVSFGSNETLYVVRWLDGMPTQWT